MKKKKLLLIMILLLTGCSSNQMICNLKISNASQRYQENSKFTIEYKNNYVKKISGYEQYNSNDKSVIEYYSKYLEKTYVNLKKEYKTVTYNKIVKDYQVVMNSTITISSDTAKKMKENNYIESSYIKNDQVSISGIKNYYEKKGFTCK